MNMSRMARVLVALGVLFALAACSSSWDRSDLVGTWERRSLQGATAQFILNEDGSASVQGVPRGALFPDGTSAAVDWSDTVSGSGEWELDDERAIILRVDEHGASLGTRLFVSTSPELGIYAFVGPAESRVFEFDRAE